MAYLAKTLHDADGHGTDAELASFVGPPRARA
jgi:hypothetical protein